MIGVDTNVVVRYLTHDDPDQTPAARQIFRDLSADAPGFVSMTVLVETWWVLRRSYSTSAATCVDLLELLLGSPELVVESRDIARKALVRAKAGADFADAVIAVSGERAGCERTMTFDKRAAQTAGMTLVEE